MNAEDPSRNFAPQPGLLEQFSPPGGPGVRVETHCRSGYRIPPNYDSMIAKVIVHEADREKAIARMQRALREFTVEPIATTIPLHQRLLNHNKFVKGDVDINFVERLLGS